MKKSLSDPLWAYSRYRLVQAGLGIYILEYVNPDSLLYKKKTKQRTKFDFLFVTPDSCITSNYYSVFLILSL
jgi:hypothetical protein